MQPHHSTLPLPEDVHAKESADALLGKALRAGMTAEQLTRTLRTHSLSSASQPATPSQPSPDNSNNNNNNNNTNNSNTTNTRLNHTQLLSVAVHALNNSTCVIPNKLPLLRDWILTQLSAKNATANQALFCIDSWRFLIAILTQPNALLSLTSAGSSSAHSLVPILTALFKNTSVWRDNNSDVNYTLLTELVAESYAIIASNQTISLPASLQHALPLAFPDLLRATLDQQVQLVVAVISTLQSLLTESDKPIETIQHVTLLLEMILKDFEEMIKVSANSKKIYILVSTVLIEPLLFLIDSDSNSNTAAKTDATRTSNISVLAKQILTLGLFHRDHMPEYIDVLQQLSVLPTIARKTKGKPKGTKKNNDGNSSSVTIMSYPKHLFEMLDRFTTDKIQRVHVIRSFPLLLQLFLDSRLKYLKNHDLSSTIDFACFQILYNMISRQVPNSSSEASSSKTMNDDTASSQEPKTCLYTQISTQLLSFIHRYNLYGISHDEVSKRHRSVLVNVNLDCVNRLKDSHTASHVANNTWAMATELLYIDYTLVVESLDMYWSPMLTTGQLCGHGDQQRLAFIQTLMETMTKAREFDSFAEKLMRYLLTVKNFEAGYDMVSRPQFLECLSSCTTTTLSAQTMALLTTLTQTLLDTITCQYPTSKPINPTLYTHALLRILSHALSAASLTQGQIPTLKTLVEKIYRGCVIPCLHQLGENQSDLKCGMKRKTRDDDDDDDDDDGNQKGSRHHQNGSDSSPSSFIQTDLMTHDETGELVLGVLYTLMNVCDLFWVESVSTDWVKGCVERLMGAKNKKGGMRLCVKLAQIVFYHIERIASTSVDPRRVEGCQDLLEMIFKHLGVNSGLFEHMTGSNPDVNNNENERRGMSLALFTDVWKALLNHLIPVCHLATLDQVKEIMSIIISCMQLTESDGKEKWEMAKITAELFQGASFYEIKSLRDIFVHIYLSKLSNSFIKACTCKKTKDRYLLSLLRTHLEKFMSSTSSSSTLPHLDISALFETHPDLLSYSSLVVSSADHSNELVRLVSLLMTFPLSYFTTRERDTIVSVLYVVEMIRSNSLFNTGDVDEKEGIALYRLGYVCRRLISRMLKNRDDSFFVTPIMLIRYIETLKSYRTSDDQISKDMSSDIRACSLQVQEKTLGKLMSRITAVPSKTNTKNLDFIKSFFEAISTSDMASLGLGVVVSLIRSILDYLIANKDSISNVEESSDSSPFAQLSHILERALDMSQPFILSLPSLFEGETCAEDHTSEIELLELTLKLSDLKSMKALSFVNNLTDLIVTSSSSVLSKIIHILTTTSNPPKFVISFGASIFALMCNADGSIHSEGDVELLSDLAWLLMKSAWGYDGYVISHMSELIWALCKNMNYTQYDAMFHKCITSFEDYSPTLSPNSLSSLLLFITNLIIGGQKYGRRGIIRKYLSSLTDTMLTISIRKPSLDIQILCFNLLAKICEDKFMDLKSTEISSFLNICCIVAVPSHLFSQTSSHPAISTEDLFESITRLLISILIHRREVVVYIIPGFIAVVRELLHCFRSQSSPQIRETFDYRRPPSSTPLTSRSAENLSRLLQKINQKTSSSSAELKTSTAVTVQPFSKHAQYIVAEYIVIQTSPNPIESHLRAVLMEGIYAMIDLSGEFGRSAVLAGLDALHHSNNMTHTTAAAARTLFKDLVGDWTKYAFKGKV